MLLQFGKFWQLFGLAACLVIPTERDRCNPFALFKLLDHWNVTVVEIVPSMLQSFVSLVLHSNRKVNLSKLKMLILTGEPLPSELVVKFRQISNVTIINAYGLSETSDDIFHYCVKQDEKIDKLQFIPIGYPIKGVSYKIVSDFDHSLTTEKKGELHIKGECMCSGYTDKKNKLNISDDGYFKTGDIVEETSEGKLVFWGRKDNQIKVNGIRIEPESIENICLQYPGIDDALITKTNGSVNGFLKLTYSSKLEISEENLKLFLTKYLPDYMVPRVMERLPYLKYSPNGKKVRK